MRLIPLLASAVLVALFSSSCATIVRGSTDTVIIRTQPEGASVSLSNGMVGTTPAQFALPRKSSVVVHIEMDGYKPLEVTLNPTLATEGETGMVGNLLVGGILGAAVDVGSGAMYDLTPNPLEVALIPLDSAAIYSNESFAMADAATEVEGIDGWAPDPAALDGDPSASAGFGADEPFDSEASAGPWTEVPMEAPVANESASDPSGESHAPGQPNAERGMQAETSGVEQGEPSGGGPASILTRLKNPSAKD